MPFNCLTASFSKKQPPPSPLMVEETNALLNERDTELLRGLEYLGVILATAWRGDVFCAGAAGSVDVVDEGEL